MKTMSFVAKQAGRSTLARWARWGLLICLALSNLSSTAVAQIQGRTFLLASVLRGYNSLMNLANIDIPRGTKVNCAPFSRIPSSDWRLTLSPGGTYLNDVIILTGKSGDVQNIAREVLGETKPLNSRQQNYLIEYAQFADTSQKIQELLRYSEQSINLYGTGTLPGGAQRPALDAIKLVLAKSLELYVAGAISTPVFADLNYITGFPGVEGNPWAIEGSPWGIEGSPWAIEGSPWAIEGSPIVGTDAEKLALTQSIAEGAFWRQWSLQSRGINIYDAAYQRALPNTADGSGSRVVLFDTAPYTTAGLTTETRQVLSVDLCVHLVPLPAIDAAPDKSGYMRDHGLFGLGLTFAAAPQSELHLVRVLDDNAVGDLYSLTAGVDGFTQSMLPQNNSTLRRVVYNFSLGLKPIAEEVPAEIQELTLELVNAMPADERPEVLGGMPLLALEMPLRTAYNLGAVIVGSAGNDSADLPQPATENAPAAYSFVLGVQSTNMQQRRSCYSNTGEVGAPGGDGGIAPDCRPQLQLCTAAEPCDYGLVSLVSEQADTVGFAYWVGSSFAAPLVSGIAADALESGVPINRISTSIVDSAAATGVVDAQVATKP